MKIRWSPIRLWLAGLALVLSIEVVIARENTAVVRSVRGTAKRGPKDGTATMALKAGMKLRPGAVVATGKDSRVDLFLGDNGPFLALAPESEVVLRTLVSDEMNGTKIIQTELELRKGRLLGLVKKLAPSSTYTVKTPVVRIEVHGAGYDLKADGRLIVFSGGLGAFYTDNGQEIEPVTISSRQMVDAPSKPGEKPLAKAAPDKVERFPKSRQVPTPYLPQTSLPSLHTAFGPRIGGPTSVTYPEQPMMCGYLDPFERFTKP